MQAVLPSPRHLLALLATFAGIAAAGIVLAQSAPKAAAAAGAPVPKGAAAAAAPTTAVATFAGGCFWCMEPPYDKLDGVLSTTSGYMGGRTRNPTYEDVVDGRDRPRRGGAGRLRPGEGQLRQAARSVLASTSTRR